MELGALSGQLSFLDSWEEKPCWALSEELIKSSAWNCDDSVEQI